ncbi:MAG: hypothetical protein J6W00_13105 [Lentisphaeria bacterium]|nr:hypothetical protein [Lentisphaeria bacterium]
MDPIKEVVGLTAVTTDSVPMFDTSHRIREEKASLATLKLFYSGDIGRYMNYSGPRFRCSERDSDGRAFTSFEITKKPSGVIICHSHNFPYQEKALNNIQTSEKRSLYSMLQCDAAYNGLEATEAFFGIRPGLAWGSYNLEGYRFHLKPFPKGTEFIVPNQDVSFETSFQNYLKKLYFNKFPNNLLASTLYEAENYHPRVDMVFDFCNSTGQVVMKIIKLYFELSDHSFCKCYIPLTRWYSKDMDHNFTAVTGLPDKQILMNLPQVIDAEKVVFCNTFEDALTMQKNTPPDSKVAFTAFACDDNRFEQVDFAPAIGKKLQIEITNHSGKSLAEEYLAANKLYEYLRDKLGCSEISFIQREITYPGLYNVFDIDALITAYRNHKPVVNADSVQELSEAEFVAMLDKAQAEIDRKREQSQDFPFWKKADTVASAVPAAEASENMPANTLFRPCIVRGSTTIIESVPGLGKSCLATAIGAQIAGCKEPFLEDRCWTCCSNPDGKPNKVAYLVFDADGTAAIKEHFNDFASKIGENQINFIQLNMAGDDIDYSRPANYGKMVALLENLRDNYGVKGQPVDALFIDTLLAFTHENIKNAFSVLTKLNREFPRMAIVGIHHLNLANKTYGGTLATMGPRAIIKLYRNSKQEEAIVGRKPTLNDPFTIDIEKFNTNKIAEDGESFELKLDEANHFVVVNKLRELAELRRLLIQGYSEKYGLNQDEIGRLFGTTGRTIRNWLNVDKKKG